MRLDRVSGFGSRVSGQDEEGFTSSPEPRTPNSEPRFVVFLRSVHRRLVIVRALERGGACAAGAAVFALALAAVQLWRGESAIIAGTAVPAGGRGGRNRRGLAGWPRPVGRGV